MMQDFTPDRQLMRRLLPIALTVFIIAVMTLAAGASHAAASPASAPPQSGTYVAGVLDNHLAVYVAGENTPALVTEIDVRTLPIADQTALSGGIALADDMALARLLEDYGS